MPGSAASPSQSSDLTDPAASLRTVVLAGPGAAESAAVAAGWNPLGGVGQPGAGSG